MWGDIRAGIESGPILRTAVDWLRGRRQCGAAGSGGTKTFPEAVKRASKLSQSASGQPKRAPRRPKEGLTESESLPGEPQGGHRRLPRAPQECPKQAEGPHGGPREPWDGRRGPENGYHEQATVRQET